MAKYESLTIRSLFFLLFAAFLWFLVFTTRTVFSPLLPFIEDEFAVSHTRASSIYTFASIGYTVSLLLNGVSSKLLGHKKSVVTSLGLAAFALFSIPFLKMFELYYISMFLVGIACGMYLPSMIPILTSYYNDKSWGKVLAIHDSGASLSTFAVPLLVTALLILLPWKGIFFVLTSILILSAVIFVVVLEKDTHSKMEKMHSPAVLWKRKELWYMGIVGAFMTGSALGLYFIIPLYLVKELGIPSGTANTILGVSRIAGIVVGISAGFIIDRFRLRYFMFSLALGAGIMTMLLSIRDIFWLKVVLLIQPCLIMAFMPALFLSISRLFETELRGQATSTLLTVTAIIGTGIIPNLLGLAGDLVSFRLGIFLLGLMLFLLSSLILSLKKLD